MYVKEKIYSYFNVSVEDETEEQHKELIKGLSVDTKVCGDFDCVILQTYRITFFKYHFIQDFVHWNFQNYLCIKHSWKYHSHNLLEKLESYIFRLLLIKF